jgi:hypothetical protein
MAIVAIILVLVTYFTAAPLIPVAVIVTALAVIFIHQRTTGP